MCCFVVRYYFNLMKYEAVKKKMKDNGSNLTKKKQTPASNPLKGSVRNSKCIFREAEGVGANRQL